MKGLEAPARSSSALRGYGVMKWRATGGKVDSLFSYFCLHPSNFLFLPFSVSRYFWRRLIAKLISWLS
jgi:hypothetical protein